MHAHAASGHCLIPGVVFADATRASSTHDGQRRVTERLATEFEVRPTLTALDLPHEPGPAGDGGGARFTYTVSSLTCT